ncbi:MAG: hypothetical protein PVI90_04750 [Desulfobacteraceae bacterium]|jgi:hypothetical protein
MMNAHLQAILLLLGIIGATFTSSLSHAEQDKKLKYFEEEEIEIPSDWGARLSSDLKANYWFTSQDDNGDKYVGHALDYKPALIPTYRVKADLLWRQLSTFYFSYESSTIGSDANDEEMLEISENESEMIQNIDAFLDFLVLTEFGENPILKFFSHMRLDYKKYIFVGKAKVQELTEYVDRNSTRTQLAPGDEIQFKSDFEEMSLSWRIFDHNYLGIYRTKTLRPHEADIVIGSLDRIVIDTETTGTGLKWIVDFNEVCFDLNLGQVEFKGDQGNFKSNGVEFIIHTEYSPYFYVLGNEESYGPSLIIAPSFGGRFSMQVGEEIEDERGELAMDIIVDTGLWIIYQF